MVDLFILFDSGQKSIFSLIDPSYTLKKILFGCCFVCLVGFGFSRQGFSVAFEPVLKLALVAQTGLELTEIHLLLPP